MEPNPQAGSAPPTPKKAGWFKWVALGCGLAVLLAVAFAGVMFFVVKKATAGPEEVVQKFLADAGAGNYEAAYDAFSAPLKESQSLADFAAAAAANPSLFQVKETSFPNRSMDMSGAEFSGTLTLESGTEMPASFKLVRENGKWKFIAYHIGSP
jgi:hypothetical protein